jgi:hypothetical protein
LTVKIFWIFSIFSDLQKRPIGIKLQHVFPRGRVGRGVGSGGGEILSGWPEIVGQTFHFGGIWGRFDLRFAIR